MVRQIAQKKLMECSQIESSKAIDTNKETQQTNMLTC